MTPQPETLPPLQMLEIMFEVEMSFMESESRDIAILTKAFHPDVVIHEPTSLPYSGDWKGLPGIAGLMQAMNQTFSKMAIEDLTCAGSAERLHVSCFLHMTSRATGVEIRQPFAQILRFHDGLLIEGTPFYFDTAQIENALTGSSSAGTSAAFSR